MLYPGGSTSAPTAPQINTASIEPKKGGSKSVLIAAVLGGFALLSGVVIVTGVILYFALRSDTGKTEVVLGNSNRAVNAANPSNSNRFKRADPTPAPNNAPSTNSSNDFDDTDLEANPITIPPSVGPFEQISSVIGNPAADFIGAVEVNKAVFSKQGKDVDFVLAKFDSRDNATRNYKEFIKGLKSSGAKVIGTQKIKNRAGVVSGDISLFTFEKKWNALAASDKHGIRITAPDRYTLLEFVKEFDKVFAAK